MFKNKFFIISLLAVFAAFACAVPAALAEFDSSNSNTGYDSQNESISNFFTGFYSWNENLELVSNDAVGENSSGGNAADFNSGDACLTSGQVSVNGLFDNSVNRNSLALPMLNEDVFSSNNNNTGALSYNYSETLFDASNWSANNLNNSFLNNLIDSSALSGWNTANSNNGSGAISAGSASIEATTRNSANVNTMAVFGNGVNPDLITGNSNTGADSVNNAIVSVFDVFALSNDNMAQIVNDLELEATSGFNSADYNSTFGSVMTGNTSAFANASTSDVNRNDTAIIGQAFNGLFEATNFSTGADTSNSAFITLTDNNYVNNSNTALINNLLGSNAISGYNSADYNNGAGAVVSGNANSMAVAQNMGINVNTTAITSPLAMSYFVAENEMTGANSYNNSEINVENSTSLTNDNNANVINDIFANSVSGGNSADYNTGEGSVNAGSASAGAMVVNQANINTTNIQNAAVASSIYNSNANTGANSTNEAYTNINSSINVTNVNEALFNNTVSVSANSGDNTSNYNTGGASVTSGAVVASFGVMNAANSNLIQ